ncbi:MAG TPA: protein kinase [Streptosporangiaceae bacterium]|nr:protein kinase [Streptosporangiaceae bacterium]
MQAGIAGGRLIADRYRLGGPIGRGAMGIVWHGRDELLARDVAVKEVQISGQAMPADAEASYQRTLREARAAARISHPSAVTVFDVVEENGSPWIVMELVDGRALDRMIAEDGPLAPREAAELGRSLLGALTAGHSAGVLHRDVKPGNVLIASDGRAVLTDFGIATLAADASQTQHGMVVGSPGFTAPERVRGAAASPASDLWSLGATLYAAVEGRGPFERAGGVAAINIGVATEDPPRAPSAGPLGPVIDALLRRDPSARPDADTASRLLAEAVETAAVTGNALEVPALLAPPVFAELSMPLHPDSAARAPGQQAGSADGGPVLWQPPRRASSEAVRGAQVTGDQARPTSGRWRLLLAGAGIAAIVTAAVVGWYLFSGNPTTQALQNPTVPGITVRGGSGPASHGSGANPPGSQPGTSGKTPAVAVSGHPGGTSSRPSGSMSASAPPGASPTPSARPGPTGPVLPPGYVWHRFTAATMGTAAGFEIGMPSAWQQSVSALSAHLNQISRTFQLTVNLAPWAFAGPLAQAEYLQRQAARSDPGFMELSAGVIGFRAVGGYTSAPTAELKFRWIKPSTGSVTELVILVTLATKAGPQPYAFTLVAPSATFGSASAALYTATPTFRPLPG